MPFTNPDFTLKRKSEKPLLPDVLKTWTDAFGKEIPFLLQSPPEVFNSFPPNSNSDSIFAPCN